MKAAVPKEICPAKPSKIFKPIGEAGIIVDMIVQNISTKGETHLTFTVPKENLKKDKNLHRKIVNQVKEKATKDTKASYGIFSTDYDTEYAYVLCYSSHVQEV